MRNLKRFLAMALSVLMVAGSFAAVSARELTDVEATDEYAVAINKLTDIGVVRGYDDDTFKADVAVERWHMALFLARLDSGRVSEEDDVNVWYSEDVVKFDDVVPGNYANAINYVVNYGMVVGTSDTTFEPNAKITYQDALTMVVRALGYGSDEMDKGYPWKYINKANELGLTDGVNAKVQFTSELTRGQTAQVLYNALYAVNAEGNTYAEKYMGQTTVMITGIKGYKIAAVEDVNIDNYVSVNVMNANGTVNTDVTYFLPVAEFNLDAATAGLVGMTYRVNTSDNFVTLDIAEPCVVDEFDTADIVNGSGDNNKPENNDLTFGGVKYDAIDTFSFLYNSQVTTSVGTSKYGQDEIMVFGYQKPGASVSEDFQYDANRNILDAKGEVVAYYVPAITGSYDAPYAAKLAEGVFVPFADEWVKNDETGKYEFVEWEAAIKAAMNGNAAVTYYATYGQITDTRVFNSQNRFATLYAYDDDGDEKYERAFYEYWSFGKVYDAGNGAKGLAGSTSITAVDAEGNALTFAIGDYVRYKKDAITNKVIIDKVYEWAPVGKVVGIAGTTFTTDSGYVGDYTKISNYPGSGDFISATPSAKLAGLFGYTVKVITETDAAGNTHVLVIDNVGTSGNTPIVFDNIIAINTNGYVKATAYNLLTGGTLIMDIATVNGYEYHEYVMLGNNLQNLNGIYDPLESGDVWVAVQDTTTQQWHLKSATTTAVKVQDATDMSFDKWTTDELKQGAVSADVTGKVVAADGSVANEATTIIKKHVQVDPSTVIIVRDTNGQFKILKNTAADKLWNYTVDFAETAEILLAMETGNGRTNYIDYLYIDGATTNISSESIVYVPAGFGVTVTNEGILGQKYSYTNLYSSTGAIVSLEVYNYQLKAGTFYRVDNDYVEAVWTAPAAADREFAAAKADGKIVFVFKADGTVELHNNDKSVHNYALKGTYFVWESDIPTPPAGPTEEELQAAAIEAAKVAVYDAMWAVISSDEPATSAAYKLLVAELNAAVDALNVALVAAGEEEVTLDDIDMLKAQAAMEAFDAATGKDMTAKVIADVAPYLPEEAADMAKTRALQCDTVARDAAKKAEYLAKAAEFYALADQTVEIIRGDYGDTSTKKDDTLTIAERLAEINDWLEENK